MDLQFPFKGRKAAEPEEPTPGGDRSPAGRAGLDAHTLRTVLAGAGAVAVLGGTGLAFLWLSSTPGGDLAADYSGVRAVPPVVAPTQTPSAEAAGYVFGGRDLFASVVPDAQVQFPDGTPPTPGPPAGAVVGTPVAPATSAPTRAGTSPAPSPTFVLPGTSTPPGTTAPPSPAPSRTGATPAPSRSTAPPWEVSTYTYLGTDAEDATAENFTVAADPVLGGYEIRVAAGTVLYPADITFRGDLGGAAHITANRGVPQGWLVPAKTAVPEAAMGRTRGTVRVIGVRNDTTFFLQVDRRESVLVEAGGQVPGTPFTFVGTTHEGLPPGAVYFRTADGTVFYGAFGAGETDGVTF